MTDILQSICDLFLESLETMPLHSDMAKRNADVKNRLRNAYAITAAENRLSLQDLGWLRMRGAE